MTLGPASGHAMRVPTHGPPRESSIGQLGSLLQKEPYVPAVATSPSLLAWLSWDHMPGADGEGDIRQAAIRAAVDAINVLIHVYSSIGWDVGYYLRLKVQLFEEHLPDTEVAAQSLTMIRRWIERGADPDGWKEDWGLDPAAAALRAAKKRDNGSAGKQGGGKEPKIPAEDPVPSVEELQGTVPHLEETSAGLPTKQVAVAARPQGPPVQAAKVEMPVGNNTAAKGPMDHFLKPSNPKVLNYDEAFLQLKPILIKHGTAEISTVSRSTDRCRGHGRRSGCGVRPRSLQPDSTGWAREVF